jgi:hypothetical protein
MQGNEPRGYLTGSTIHNLDFTLRREFKLTEAIKLQWRLDAFNLMNVNFRGTPDLGLGDSYQETFSPRATFGRISSVANSPRAMQMALKIMF